MTMIMKEEILQQDHKNLMMITEEKEAEAEVEEVEEECQVEEEAAELASSVMRKVTWLESVLILIPVIEVEVEEVVEEPASSVMRKVTWLESALILILVTEAEVEEEEALVEEAENAINVTKKVTWQENVQMSKMTEIVGLTKGREEKMVVQ